MRELPKAALDGTLAEYVRTPFADTSLYHLPDTLDKEVAVFLSDALPTGHEIGVQYGEVKPGSDIMIVGAGPVEMGATHTVNPANDDVKEGGNIAVVGVHGKPVEFQLKDMWVKNLTVTTGLVNANTTGMLMKAVQNSDLPITSLATHHFTWDQLDQAWETFSHADTHQAMKVIIDNP